LVVALLFALLWSLGFITRHNDYEKVPTVTGKSVAAATELLEEAGFSVEIQDSVWDEKQPPLSVIRQSPEADQMVKAHRHIYLTVNRSEPPLVDVPNLVGLSFRNAELYLKQLGLKLGDTSRRPDIAKDAILEQLYQGKNIQPGTRIYQGSSISFILGSGLGEEEFEVPNLVGVTYGQAKVLLNGLGLMVAGVLPDAGITDTANAYVYRQNPEVKTMLPDGTNKKNMIKPGQGMDVWLSKNAPVISNNDSIPKQPEGPPN